MKTVFLLGITLLALVNNLKCISLEEEEAEAFMNLIDVRRGIWTNKETVADWNYSTNVTDENSDISVQVGVERSKFEKDSWTETVKYDWKNFESEDLRRKFYKSSVLGTAALPEEQLEKLLKAVSNMQSHYAKTTVCDYSNKTNCDLALDPDISEIFEKSQNPDELKDIWTQWHDKAGAPMRQDFQDYVSLSNEAAKLNNFSSYADLWIDIYETEGFEAEMARLLEEIKPLFLQIHAYVRKRLYDKYGENVLSRRGPIPAHLLGNVWAQEWTNVQSFTLPYPETAEIDVTANLIAQNYTALKIFETAEEFYTSLGMPAMTPTFWEKSIIEKPEDGREFVCHASAWDFYKDDDFRVKMCTSINQVDFKTVHHEMGHIQYFQIYNDQPRIYREGANPGFHEAVGDTIALSVMTVKHLKKIGVLPEDFTEDAKTEINALYRMGIEKIVFLPFAYILDVYRYGIFRGETNSTNYNCNFWKLREELQGIAPPVSRSEENFDAGAKYHIAANVEYMRYYVSFLVQFQFYRSLCVKAGQYNPGSTNSKLVNCDFYQSKEAGEAFKNMLALGSSRPWPDALEQLTGTRELDAKALLEYFEPLYQWLKAENERTGELIGWEKSTVDYCPKSSLKNVHNSPRE